MGVWQVEGWETPVQCNGKTTHIDLLLRHAKRRGLRIVGECEHPQAPQSNWHFVRTPFPSETTQMKFFERVSTKTRDDGSPAVWVALEFEPTWPNEERPYGLALPKGTGGNPSALEEVIAQVLRGVSGLIDRFAQADYWKRGVVTGLPIQERSGLITPAIFTTATL